MKRNKSSKKIIKLKKGENTFLIKRNNINNSKIDSTNSTFFTRNKKNHRNLSYINDYRSYNNNNKNELNLYNEKEGIFKMAVKYDYLIKKNKNI